MHGLAVVMAPAMKLLFKKIAGDTEKQPTGVLLRVAGVTVGRSSVRAVGRGRKSH